MRTLASRLDGIPTTIFTTMSALALRTGSVNLGQGFPDTDGPQRVIERAQRALAEGENQYAPGIGRPELRRAIVGHQQRHYGLELDPDTQVAVTTGCTEGIAAAILGLVDPGDEVVALDPTYDSYPAMVRMTGATLRTVPLRAPDFRLDADQLRDAITARTALLLINTPHNPTGTVLDAAELGAIAEIAIEHDLTVVTDEVYEHLTFDGVRHVPLATLPGMAERTLTLSSVGKSYSFTGWKVGWATGPAELVSAVMAAKQWLSFTSAGPLQSAVAVALEEEREWPRELAASLEARRDKLLTGLRDLGIQARPPEGTYFVLSDVAEFGFEDGADFCRELVDRAKVTAIPLQSFYADPAEGRHLVRWAFCKEAEVIDDGLERLRRANLRPRG